MAQLSIPCVVYRGGTSRGLFFHERDLPKNKYERNKIFYSGIDANNPSQINGLGSGTSHSSKVVVISPSSQLGIDINYTFYQIGIGEKVADDTGTCGNLMSAAAAFAIDEGLIDVSQYAWFALVSMFNTNINKVIKIRVPLVDGKARVKGNYYMTGLVTPGAKFKLDILDPGGSKTGETLPIGKVTSLKLNNKVYKVSFVDIVNPFVFISCKALGLTWQEVNDYLNNNTDILDLIESIRAQIAIKSKMLSTIEETKKNPAIPKIAIIDHPQGYVANTGEYIIKEKVDIVAKMLSVGRLHKNFAGSGLFNLAAATLISGTIPNQYIKEESVKLNKVVRIGHPGGISKVNASLSADRTKVSSVGLERTARRIMKGQLYY